MQSKQWLVRSGLALSVFGVGGLIASLPAAAQSQQPSTATEAKPSTMAPAKANDQAADFTKLDKNNDGFLDKGEAATDAKLLGKWAEADTNKDGKISKDEFLSYKK
jgi:hypothetical protein